MRTRWLGLFAALAAFTPMAGSAVDAPHDGSATNGTCEACHKTHNATGGTLLNQPDNNTACTTCHNDPATTINQSRLGLPWATEDQAVPGKGGSSHRWDAVANAPAFGASLPTDSEMLKRIKDGRIQCAACHDLHSDVKAFDPTAQHASLPFGVATAPTGGPAGLNLSLAATNSTASTAGYRVQVVYYAAPNFRVAVSHNAKTTDGAPTWYIHNGTTWVVGDTSGTSGTLRTVGTAVTLDDPNVQVTFTGTPAVGQFWDFYVSYAHLRASNVSDALCIQCHSARNQTHVTVEGPGNGTAIFSHPVGQALNANAKGYDRAAANLLDANGALQTAGDNNLTNNLTLDVSNTVRCTTCHNVHNADSNSLTVDPR